MTEIRTFEIRQCASFVREARIALREGDHPKAVRYAKLATRGLYFFRGLVAGRGAGATMATAGLTRVLDHLWDAIGTALRPAPAADPDDLLQMLAEGLKSSPAPRWNGRRRRGRLRARPQPNDGQVLANYDVLVKTHPPVDGSKTV